MSCTTYVLKVTSERWVLVEGRGSAAAESERRLSARLQPDIPANIRISNTTHLANILNRRR